MTIPIRTGRKAGPALDLSKLNLNALKAERDRCIASADSKNPPITRVLPVPRAIPLGGSLHVARELTLGDLARLQAWLEAQVPHPLAEIPPSWADPEPATRLVRLAVAWEAAGSWPVRYGTRAGQVLLGSLEGRAYFLTLVVPGLTAGAALELLGRITPTEWAGLRRIAYGLTPREEIADEVAPESGPNRSANWALSLHRAGEHPGGPSYAEAREWTVGQWRNFCAEGKPADSTPEFAAQAKQAKQALGKAHV